MTIDRKMTGSENIALESGGNSLVPTLRVGMPSPTLRVVFGAGLADRGRTRSVRDGHSHAERGNEPGLARIRRPTALIRAMIAAGACLVGSFAGPAEGLEPPSRPLVLVHYMPWFVAKPASPVWGWHWTMNAFDPDKVEGGRRPIASHLDPLIGPYDSGDPAVIEYHLLLIKLAGFDGLIVDWYGLSNRLDYPILHGNTLALFRAAAKVGLKVGICYEDQTVARLVETGEIASNGRVAHAKGVLAWLRENWFKDPAYLKLGGRPVLLSFGSDGLTDAEWAEVLSSGPDSPIYLSEHHRRPVASGAFDWPIPKEGLAPLARFEEESRSWPVRMPVAFPRFLDIYAEAKVHPSYGSIPDDDGRTFTTTLKRAIQTGAPLVQVATWNDWGEGTAIEPSTRYGYRDLEAAQRLRRDHIDPQFATTGEALRLAHRLYLLRTQQARPGLAKSLGAIANDLAAGRIDAAGTNLTIAETL